MKERFGLHVAPHERPPVAWYAPSGLARVAREQLWSLNLLRNLDRRETFTEPFSLIDLRGETDAAGDCWIDFISDTGDGGSATTTVAQALLADRLPAQGLPGERAEGLPVGRVLVLGGDLAYPGASPAHYQARLVEPFELARPREAFDEDRVVVAIPQNHDWLDSLSTFCRYFVNDGKAGLLRARAPQTRSYFALALPHGWFWLGFDFALSGDLDRGQFDAFRRLLLRGEIPRGARVLLLYPEPYWTREIGDRSAAGYPRRYQRLEALLMAHGCEIRMRLAGDLHHYVRETLPAQALGHASELVTCGSGGAFGHPTHTRETLQPKYLLHGEDRQAAQAELRQRVLVGRSPGGTPAHDPARDQLHRYSGERRCYPDEATSRRRAAWNLVALLAPRQAGFALLLGLLVVLLMRLLPGAWQWLALAPLALAAATVGTENDPLHARGSDWIWPALMLAGGAGLFCALQFLQAWMAAGWPAALPGPRPATLLQWFLQSVLLWLVAVPGIALVFGSVLALANGVFGRLPNNGASALPGECHKGFLRLRVHAGGIEAFMLGTDHVPRRWQRNPEGWPMWQAAAGEAKARWRVVDRFEMPG